MPKKTKEEKIKASRRKFELLFKDQNVPEIQLPHKKPNTEMTTPETKKIDTTGSIYFKNDFKKSITLISAIIALEIILYYGTINNYFSFLKFK